MVRLQISAFAVVLVATVTAGAETPVQRGDYLVNGVLT
jgi:hypothetical protein